MPHTPSAAPDPRPDDLVALATAHRVATEYSDWEGQQVTIPAATLRAVLTAIGVDASTPDELRRSLAAAAIGPGAAASGIPSVGASLAVPECLVVREARAERFEVYGADSTKRPRPRVVAELEDGSTRDLESCGGATFVLPVDLPTGYHQLVARAERVLSRGHLIVVPSRVPWPDALTDRRAWGVLAQLYSVRSTRSWGVGDLADLGALAEWAAAQHGADFILVNPLHAAEPVAPMTNSPYLPTTRRFPNPIYLRVEEIPEHAALGGSQQVRIAALAAPLRAAVAGGAPIDRDATWPAMREALRLVYAVPREPERESAFASYVAREGADLADFALWCAYVVEHGPNADEQPWTEELRDRDPETVERLRLDLADEIGFQCWLQWVLDDQLAAAQHRARVAGMAIGVVHDLAVGVHQDGADVWRLGPALARGVTVGAPADAFNQRGQDWSQPPWNPVELARTGYRAWRDVIRAVLRHAGGVRVDHVLGLFRLWLVPEGAPPDQGTYLRYDHEALVGILVLEASRAGAIVVGEDLGTFEPWVRDYLAERGILGTSLLWFERENRDGVSVPKPAAHWRELALATIGTHDLPPTAGFLVGAHIELRARLGLLTRPVEQEWAAELFARDQWLVELERAGLLRPGANVAETVRALDRFVLSTPSRLVGLQLVDLVGDVVIQNQPGTDTAYPNWCQPLRDQDGRPVLIEDLPRVVTTIW